MSDRLVRYVTLAYGDAPGVYRQSLMLVVSLVAHAEPCTRWWWRRIDRAVWFGTRVEIDTVDPTLLEAWKGSDPFSMRQKLALLRAAWPDQATSSSSMPMSSRGATSHRS